MQNRILESIIIRKVIAILLCIGILVIPFILKDGVNTRDIKWNLALGFAFVISLLIFYSQKVEFRKPWTLGFLGFLMFNIWLCAKTNITLGTEKIIGIWLWPTACYYFVFGLFLIALCNVEFNKAEKNWIYKSLIFSGFIMSLYCIGQYFGLDQWVGVSTSLEALHKPMSRVSGTLGHPTLVASFIAMIIPITLYKHKLGGCLAIPMIIAVCLTRSQMAIGAMIVGLVIYISLINRKALISTISALIIVFLIGITGYFVSPNIKAKIDSSSSGRVQMWKAITKDLTKTIDKDTIHPRIYTGKGMGTFRFMFHLKNKEFKNLIQAHNEYLELLYDLGIIGLFLFLMAFIEMIKPSLRIDYNKHLLASIIIISLNAVGAFVWHLGPILFISIIIIGLINTEREY